MAVKEITCGRKGEGEDCKRCGGDRFVDDGCVNMTFVREKVSGFVGSGWVCEMRCL